MEGDMRAGSCVVPVALNKVIQLKSDGVAFRFLPDSSQVANAIKLMEDEGLYARQGFPGVPVFQSRSLVLMSDNKRYRPAFFRKEDLDNSLHRTSRDQQKTNPAVRAGDTQVSSLEDTIKSIKDSSSTKWDDIVFILLDLTLLLVRSHNTSTHRSFCRGLLAVLRSTLYLTVWEALVDIECIFRIK